MAVEGFGFGNFRSLNETATYTHMVKVIVRPKLEQDSSSVIENSIASYYCAEIE